MIKTIRNIVIAVAAIALLPLATAQAARKPDLLSYVPADSPYVIAMTEPFPEELMDKLQPATEKMLESYRGIVEFAFEQIEQDLGAKDTSEEEVAKFRALADEFIGLVSMDGLESIGMARDASAAVYGYGLLPVVRIELTDSALFEELVKRIETKAGASLSVGEVRGKSYKYFAADDFRLMIATLDGQLVLTAVPAAYDDAQIGEVLGIKKPRRNLSRSKKIRDIETEYGYKGYMTGFIDTLAIAGAFYGERSDADDDLFAATPLGEAVDDALSDTCRAEFMDIAGIAPRMVFGYSEANVDELRSSFVIELREDIASEMTALTSVVPGLGSDPGGLFSFGMSLNPMALKNFFEARLDALEADPYECEALADLQGGVAQGRAALAQPIPPIVYAFRGFVANIVDVEGMDLANDTPPTSVDGSLLVAVDNAEALLMMGAMMDPMIAEMNLQPDGKAVAIVSDKITSTLGEAFAAMTEQALAIAVGEGSEAGAEQAVVADGSDPGPFMSVSLDVGRYYGMIGDAMLEMEAPEDGKEMPLEVRESMRDMLHVVGDIYERMLMDTHFTERGIEVDAHITLGE